MIMGRAMMFNVRMEADLLNAIEDAAAKAGLTKSVWAREVMGAIAMGGVSLEKLRELAEPDGRSPHPVRYLALQGRSGRSEKQRAECLHPRAGVKRLPFTDVCGACGETLRRR